MAILSQPGETGTSNLFKIYANIFIAFIGAGVLGLPYAFKEAGILEGICVMMLVAILSVKSMLLLVECKYRIIHNWEMGDIMSSKSEGLFSNIANNPSERVDLLRSEELLITGVKEPKRTLYTFMASIYVSYGDVGYEAVGSAGRLLVDFSIVLSQIGFCCAYLIFICRNMSDIVPHIEMGHWLLIVLPVLSLLTLLRHLNSLALTSILAQFSIVCALSVVLWFDFQHFHSVRIHPREISFENLPFFFVIAVYCFEGAGLILSLEGSLAKDIRHKFSKYFILTMVFVTLLYISFGVCGYMSFGPDTSQIITLNLPKSSGFGFSLVVKSCLCLALFFTYPVMMFPVMKILEHYFIPDAGNTAWKGNILRGLVVLLTGMIVILVPNFADLMALVGACCCTLLSFILPGFFHMRLFKGNMHLKQLMFDWLLITVGVLGTFFGVWNSVVHMSGPNMVNKLYTETSTTAAYSLMSTTLSVTELATQNSTETLTKTMVAPYILNVTDSARQKVTGTLTGSMVTPYISVINSATEKAAAALINMTRLNGLLGKWNHTS
ncbi:unnamed protein product [Candidula unifasciata]|uniref:Amino acid transporter transmembrane domain-containing protein n=1 Tax=Candidula unifasciata TaxID=100452 RepID=A0A8S4A0M1_9EUPU|nr:unnamed protein product [Candidula unifasciata]